MISDLSPGDRMSLKGKLFELQKKLNIIDIENKLDERYSYKPTIISYELPNRQKDFIENTTKAEIIRKQRKKMLTESIVSQTEEQCTFKPKIYSTKNFNQDSRPVHVRLTEKAKHYIDSKEKKRELFHSYDEDGRKLFSPKINKNSINILNSSHSKKNDISMDSSFSQNNTLSADDFLYQDAKNREIRLQNLIHSYEKEIKNESETKKVNKTSEKLLEKKIEKQINNLIYLINDNQDTIDYDEFHNFIESSKILDKYELEQKFYYTQFIWDFFDYYSCGKIEKKNFFFIYYTFLQTKSNQMCFSLIEKHFNNKEDNGLYLDKIKKSNIQLFRNFINQLVEYTNNQIKLNSSMVSITGMDSKFNTTLSSGMSLNASFSSAFPPPLPSSSAANANSASFQPHINQYSYKLAERKEKKDLYELAQVQKELKSTMKSTNEDNNAVSPSRPPLPPSPPRNVPVESEVPPPPPSDESLNNSDSISIMSSDSADISQINTHQDLMIARALLAQKKKEKIKKELEEKEKNICTFHPVLHTTTTAEHWSKLKLKFQKKNEKNDLQPINDLENEKDNENNNITEKDEEEGNDDNQIEKEDDAKTIAQVPSVPVFERLYKQRNQLKLVDKDIIKQEDKELIGCTFKPEINPMSKLLLRKNKKKEKTIKHANNNNLNEDFINLNELDEALLQQLDLTNMAKDTIFEGNEDEEEEEEEEAKEKETKEFKKLVETDQVYRRTIERMRTAASNRLKQIEEKLLEEAGGSQLSRKEADERRNKLRQDLLIHGPSAPKLLSEERIMKKHSKVQNKNVENNKPDLIVNVKLSVSRSARLRIKNGDDPDELTKRFAMIYGLDTHSQGVLHAVIIQSMAAHGILPIEEKKEIVEESSEDFDENYDEEYTDSNDEDEEEYLDEEPSSSYYDEDEDPPTPPTEPYPY